MVVVVIVNDNVFVSVTCGGVVVVAPTICVVSTPPPADVDAVTGRDVIICWMCGPPAIPWALDLMYDCGAICWTTTCCCLKIIGDAPACSFVTGWRAATAHSSTHTHTHTHTHTQQILLIRHKFTGTMKYTLNQSHLFLKLCSVIVTKNNKKMHFPQDL